MSLTHELEPNACIMVLGMHRSGTSALTGVLNALGLHVGSTLVPANENVNPKGFWENPRVVDFHERLLAAIGSSWNDERPLLEKWWQLAEVQPFHQELTQILQNDFANLKIWAVKDPRMCRLMPLWGNVLESVGCSPRVVIILRDPREVAKSLASRDGIAEERSALLWLRHMLEAERWTRDYPRTIITFEGLLEDWQETVGQVEVTLGLKLNCHDLATQQRVEEFLEPSLRHHIAVEPPSGSITKLSLAAYRVLAELQEPEELKISLAKIESHISELTSLIAPWSGEVQALFRARSELNHKLYVSEAKVVALCEEIIGVKNTFSWRITAPLRWVRNFFLKIGGKGNDQNTPGS